MYVVSLKLSNSQQGRKQKAAFNIHIIGFIYFSIKLNRPMMIE